MSPTANSRRADAVAPYARRRTRPPSRTGSTESVKSWVSAISEKDALDWSATAASCGTSGIVTELDSQSEHGEHAAEMIENISQALDRLDRRVGGMKRVNEGAITV